MKGAWTGSVQVVSWGHKMRGTGAEAAAIFLHEGDIDNGVTKRIACQNK